MADVLKLQNFLIMVGYFKIFLIFIRRAKRVDSDIPFTFSERWYVTTDITKMSRKVIIIMPIGKFQESKFLILCQFFGSIVIHVLKIIIIWTNLKNINCLSYSHWIFILLSHFYFYLFHKFCLFFCWNPNFINVFWGNKKKRQSTR